MNKTKIIATLNKDNCDKGILKQLILNGINAFKINIDNNNFDFCSKVISLINELNDELKTHVAIMLDMNGPIIKIGHILNGEAKLNKEDKIRIYKDSVLGDYTKFSVDYNLFNKIPINTSLTTNSGLKLRVLDKQDDYLLCHVLKEGIIKDDMILNVENIKVNKNYLNDIEKNIILFSSENNVDFLILSNISSSEDVLEVNDLLISIGNDHLQIVSKVDNRFAVLDIDKIIKISDVIIIDQKSLGDDIAIEKVPGIQKRIISKCICNGVINIVMTELNEGTNYNKSDVSDIANAILDGTDCVMLSLNSEPIKTIQMLKRIINTVEEDIDYEYMLSQAIKTEKKDATGSLAYSVAGCALRLKCKAIFTPTMSGYTAKRISRFRPICPIIAPTPDELTTKSLALSFGVYPILIDKLNSLDAIIEKSKILAKNILLLKEKDNIILTGGYPFKKVKHTNFMKIEEL